MFISASVILVDSSDLFDVELFESDSFEMVFLGLGYRIHLEFVPMKYL